MKPQSITIQFVSKVEDMKAVRSATDLGLLESKQIVDTLWSKKRNNAILPSLKAGAFGAVLTGSRFFGSATESCDWDFAIFGIENFNALKDALEQRGKNLTNCMYANNPFLNEYLDKRDCISEYMISDENIHIHYRRDNTRQEFLKAQQIIKQHYDGSFLQNKSDANRIWTSILQALGVSE